MDTKNKGGRPRKYPSEGALARLGITIPASDKARLAFTADAFGLSISEFVLRLLRKGMTDELLEEANRLSADRSSASHLIGDR